MTKIITTGCSFTHAPNSWANYLKEKYEWMNINNIAHGGAGNQLNIRNTLTEIYSNTSIYTHCIAQISGINRFELAIDNPIVHEQIGDFIITKEYYSWIKSTGDQKWWRDEGLKQENFENMRHHKIVGDALEAYVKHCHSEVNQIFQTLMHILHLQTVCQQKGIRDFYFCWKNEFEQYMDQIKKSKELYVWWNRINWDKFYFFEKYGGISEWGIYNGYAGDLRDDHMHNPPQGWIINKNKKEMLGHPSTECHTAFAEQIIKPWINNA